MALSVGQSVTAERPTSDGAVAGHAVASQSRRRAAGGLRYTPLARQIALANAFIVVVACMLTVLVLSPRKLGSVAWEEAVVLAGVLTVLVVLDVLALRRALKPLERLTALTRSVDPTRPGERVTLSGPPSEATELALAFNDMLERLERERSERTGRVLAAQEGERLRVAQELHDEVGQTLTALLLQLSQAIRGAPAGLVEQLVEAQETARTTLSDVRRIALELRPEALDDLGLQSALEAMCNRLEERTGLRITRRVSRDVPTLSREVDLVVYRVAQEAMTNVVRHSGSSTALLELAAGVAGVSLVVSDNGRGLPVGLEAENGVNGLRGMRERAVLVGAVLSVGSPEGEGVTVRLDVPVAEVFE